MQFLPGEIAVGQQLLHVKTFILYALQQSLLSCSTSQCIWGWCFFYLFATLPDIGPILPLSTPTSSSTHLGLPPHTHHKLSVLGCNNHVSDIFATYHYSSPYQNDSFRLFSLTFSQNIFDTPWGTSFLQSQSVVPCELDFPSLHTFSH